LTAGGATKMSVRATGGYVAPEGRV